MEKDDNKNWPEAEAGFSPPSDILRSLSRYSQSSENLMFSHPDAEYRQLLQWNKIRGPGT